MDLLDRDGTGENDLIRPHTVFHDVEYEYDGIVIASKLSGSTDEIRWDTMRLHLRWPGATETILIQDAKEKDVFTREYVAFFEKWNPINRPEKKPLLNPLDSVDWKELRRKSRYQ